MRSIIGVTMNEINNLYLSFFIIYERKICLHNIINTQAYNFHVNFVEILEYTEL